MNLSYILNHLGEERENYYNAIAPPILQSSNFSFTKVAHLRQAFQQEHNYHLYTRGNNPTVEILRKKLAALAGAEDALVFASGAGAMAAAVISNVQAGDHIICISKPYGWTEKLCRKILVKFGVETTFVDGILAEDFLPFVKENTRLIILESPNTFTFQIQDLKSISSFAKLKNITTIIDNTYCTPLGQKCIEMGIDLEVHSASKYLNGHSDIVAGVVIGSEDYIRKIFQSEFMNLGAIISPHDAWLMIRGLRTLPLRLKQISETTNAVVDFLEKQEKVAQIFYPFSTSFSQHNLAKKQMSWCGGLFSILLHTSDTKKIEKFCEDLTFFKMAVSWGGYESLLMPACSFYENNFEGERKYPINLIRFYIGLEDPEILIQDLKKVLEEI